MTINHKHQPLGRIKYSAGTFLQCVRLFQTLYRLLFCKNPAEKLSFSISYNPGTYACVTFLSSNTAKESWNVFLGSLRGIWKFKTQQSQLDWWLARYGWPASMWVLSTLKATRAEPTSILPYGNFLQPSLNDNKESKNMKQTSMGTKNLAAGKPWDADTYGHFTLEATILFWLQPRQSQGFLRWYECFSKEEVLAKAISILHPSRQSQRNYAYDCWGWEVMRPKRKKKKKTHTHQEKDLSHRCRDASSELCSWIS